MKKAGVNYHREHLYSVGQIVSLDSSVNLHLAPGALRSRINAHRSGSYEILAKLPVGGADPNYRVRSQEEPHDRIVAEYEIVTAQPAKSVDMFAAMKKASMTNTLA